MRSIAIEDASTVEQNSASITATVLHADKLGGGVNSATKSRHNHRHHHSHHLNNDLKDGLVGDKMNKHSSDRNPNVFDNGTDCGGDGGGGRRRGGSDDNDNNNSNINNRLGSHSSGNNGLNMAGDPNLDDVCEHNNEASSSCPGERVEDISLVI